MTHRDCSNIDRLFAIYQALYPDKYVSERKESSPSGALYPFRKDSGNYWNSNDVRDWTTLGFAVPGNKELDADGRKELEKYLDENYHWLLQSLSP